MVRAEPGRVLAARYRLLAVIRQDEVGAVWLASDGMRHTDVVVRAVPWASAASAGELEAWRERALREAREIAQLDHPNIARTLGIVADEGQPWLVLEAAPYRFPYRPLGDVLCDEGPLRPEQAAHIGRQVAAAIGQAHATGVLHRDIRPGNILLGAGNRAVLVGFGMVTADGGAALARSGAWAGSPSYMAPERARGEPATPAGDLWSLGATLYAAVEGRVPFGRDGEAAVLAAVIASPPDPPRRAGQLWPVISGLLRKDPAARPDPRTVDWLLRRVAAGQGAAQLTSPAGAARNAAAVTTSGLGTRDRPGTPGRPARPARAGTPTGPAPTVPAATSGLGTPDRPARPARADAPTGPAPTVPAASARQPREAGSAGSSAGFIPGFAPRDRATIMAQRPRRRSRRPQRPSRPEWLSRPHWWLAASAGAVAVVTAIVIALWPGAASTPGHSLAVRPGRSLAAPPDRAGSSPGRAPTGTGSGHATGEAPNTSRASRAVPPGAAVPGPVRPVSPAPRRSPSGAVPAGFFRYRDPTGFSIGVPDNWRVSHQGHLVYVQDPNGSRFLIIDQTGHPKPNPLADWRQQEAARIGTYPGYHRIRLKTVHYPQAERAADWEFTYLDNGQLTHVLNRNVLASAHHAYALYWSTPARSWRASYHYFRAFASTFRPAPAGAR